MRITNLIGSLMKGLNSAARFLNWVGYVSITGLVLVTFVDVTGRYSMNKPLMGSLEITEITMVVLGGFAMFYTTTQRGHISVDLFFVRFPRRAQIIIDSVGSLLGFGTWGIIAYQTYLLGLRVLEAGDTTSFLSIPLSPFQFIFALGIALYSLTLFIQTLHLRISGELEKKEGGLGI